MTSTKKFFCGAAAAAAAVPLVLVGAGTAGAMGGALPQSVAFTSTNNSITAHIDAGYGITNCRLVVQGSPSSNWDETGWSSDTALTLAVDPGTYAATVFCKTQDTPADGVVARTEQVTAPPSFIDMLIDLLETGSS